MDSVKIRETPCSEKESLDSVRSVESVQKIRTKKKFMKPTLQLLTAAVMSIGGLILLFCGIFIDPQGEIDSSLLIGFGEVATFAGALFGIDYTYRYKK